MASPHGAEQPDRRKVARLNLRASARQDALIRQAAAVAGKNVTEFVLESACSNAEHVLADRRRFVLDDAAWARFMQALDRPVTAKPRLKALFDRPSVLERP
jgi:uncharacterized protein (DUF1778 family)